MLRQILRDLWVEPELLAELDEEQRLTLFCHMRAEQVRRWAEREKTLPPVPPRPPPKPGAKRVDWLLGADGEPWVWVMGDHPNDVSPPLVSSGDAQQEGELLFSEGDQSASPEDFHLPSKQQQTRLQVDVDLSHEFLQSAEEGIYCSVDELRAATLGQTDASNGGVAVERRGALQEISLNKNAGATNAHTAAVMPERPDKVWQRVALWERRVAEERGVPLRRRKPSDHSADHSADHSQHQEALRRISPDEQREELAWREQERRAKEAEQQIREIARRAREEHRRTSVLAAMEVDSAAITSQSSVPSDNANNNNNDNNSLNNVNNNSSTSSYTSQATPTAKPPSTEAVIEWFRSSEVARHAGLAPGTNLVATWFHGLISRQEAEHRLETAPESSFLVRVSERVWGYAISFKAPERCKHFLIDASSGQYQFLGAHQNTHSSLGELVDYHSRHPITLVGGERLLHPCTRSEVPSIFQGLLMPSVRR